MPTIPIIQDSAQLQTQTGLRRVQGDPNAFGARQAQGLQEVGAGLGKVAQAANDINDRFDEANALELDNQLTARIRDRLYNTDNGYLSTARGANAVDQRGQTEADIDGYAADLASQARTPQAAAMFARVARQRTDSALGQIAGHAVQETDRYYTAQSEARITQATDDAVAAYGDDATVATNIALATAAVHDVAQRNGLGPEWEQSRVRAIQSDIYGRVLGQLATADPTRAETMYEQIRPHLSAQEAGEIRTTMQVAQRQYVDNIEGAGWQAYANNQPLSSIGENAYHEMINNPLLGAAHARLVEAYRQRARAYAAGTTIHNDSPAYIAAQLAATENPQLFLQQGQLEAYLAQNAGNISPSDMVSLIQLRQRMQTTAQDVQAQNSSFNALIGPAQAALAPYGIDLSISDSAAARNAQGQQAAARANAFRAALMRANQQFFLTHARAPAGDEVQHVIGQAILGMNDANVQNLPSFNHGFMAPQSNPLRAANRPGIANAAVAPTSETVVPPELIPQADHVRIAEGLTQLLGRTPTYGEVQNYYGAELQGIAAPIDPRSLSPQARDRIIQALRQRDGREPSDNDIQQAISQIISRGR